MRPLSFLATFLAVAILAVGCGDDEDDRGNLRVEGTTGTSAGTSPTTGTSPETTGTTGAAAPSGPVVATIAVRETEFRLRPANPRISNTGVVAFRVRNAGDVVHALEVEGPGGERETERIDPGGSATLKVSFDRPGRYRWYCPVGDHESRGMKGVITVIRGRAKPSDAGGSRRSRGAGDRQPDDTGRRRGRGGGASGSSGSGSGSGDGRDDGRSGGVSGY